MPIATSTRDAARRKPSCRSSPSTSSATPPAMSASAVRIQARKVRSLASVNRASGSLPREKTERGNLRSVMRRPSGIPHCPSTSPGCSATGRRCGTGCSRRRGTGSCRRAAPSSHRDPARAGWPWARAGSSRLSNQSSHHSQTFPTTCHSPYPLGSNVRTGAVVRYPSSRVFTRGNWPCQMFARHPPSSTSASPHGYFAWSIPPRAAYSHSASVGSRRPAHSQ